MVGYVEQPGGHLSPLGMVVGVPIPHVSEYVLSYLLGCASVSDKTHRERKYGPGVPTVQVLQGFPRLLDDESHQLLIVSLFEIHVVHLASSCFSKRGTLGIRNRTAT